MIEPPTRRSYQRGLAKRQALLAAAQAGFAQAGWHGAGVEDLAARAGATKNQLFYYFHSKEGLASAALDEALRQWQVEIAGPATIFPDPSAALAYASQALDKLIDQGWTGLGLWASLAADRPALPPALAAKLDANLGEVGDFFRRRYREMKQRGWLDSALKARAVANLALAILLGTQLTLQAGDLHAAAGTPGVILQLFHTQITLKAPSPAAPVAPAAPAEPQVTPEAD